MNINDVGIPRLYAKAAMDFGSKIPSMRTYVIREYMRAEGDGRTY